MECCHLNDIGHDNRLDNLRWDTRSANVQDCITNGGHNHASKTHCKRGHEFTDANTRIVLDRVRPRRSCRACEYIRGKATYERNKLDT